jgi:hypothetical protein
MSSMINNLVINQVTKDNFSYNEILMYKLIEEGDENYKGFTSGYSWQLGLSWG